jgi:hypothetical protein
MVRAPLVVLFIAAAVAVGGACSNPTKPPNAPGDDLVNDTNEEEAGPPQPNQPVDAAPMDSSPPVSADASYVPMLMACASCNCSMTTGFCFAGGTHMLGPSDAPACMMVAGPAIGVGCNALPAACAANPTCACVIDAIQPQFNCYLVCTPDPGYFLVYCPS